VNFWRECKQADSGMNDKSTDSSQIERDILEWNMPSEVLSVLLMDRTTGRNLIWATDDYCERGSGFAAGEEIKLEQIVDRKHPVIRPRVDKGVKEQRKRVEDHAEVFTPSWICNKQNNLVDAAWFEWKLPNSSPFNNEADGSDSENGFGWKSTSGKRIVKFPAGKTWRDYVKAPRLEIACGEAPYLASRYDTVSGRVIPVGDRIGLLDRKLRVITENIGTSDTQEWLFYAKRAVQSVYGFDWQGDNVILARENVLATVVETFNADFLGEKCSYAKWSVKTLLEFAEIISWNIWQMDGVKYVVPMSCERNQAKKQQAHQPMFDGTSEPIIVQCPGCKRNDKYKHSGDYCMVMDWQASPEPKPIRFIDLMGGSL